MKFAHFLETSGWTKADVARQLGLSRGALTSWDDIPEKWVSVLEGVFDEIDNTGDYCISRSDYRKVK